MVSSPARSGHVEHFRSRVLVQIGVEFPVMSMADYKLMHAGDTALVIEFGNRLDRGINFRVLALARRLRELKLEGLVEAVPTIRSLMVHFDPLVLPAAALAAH